MGRNEAKEVWRTASNFKIGMELVSYTHPNPLVDADSLVSDVGNFKVDNGLSAILQSSQPAD